MKGWVGEPVTISLPCFDICAQVKDFGESGAGRAPDARVDVRENRLTTAYFITSCLKI